MMRAALLVIGSELTQGARLDTNSQEIAKRLAEHDIFTAEMVNVADDFEVVAQSFQRLIDGHDLVISTGGLGPTHDDVTREAAAQALGIALTRTQVELPGLDAYQARQSDPRVIEALEKERDVLEGAQVIVPRGTAPGQFLEFERDGAQKLLVLLPGPPSECLPMLERVLERFERKEIEVAHYALIGKNETEVTNAVLDVLIDKLGIAADELSFTVLACMGETHVVLQNVTLNSDTFSQACEAVEAALGDAIYTKTGENLQEYLVKLLAERGENLSVAESLTGGLLGATIAQVSGASEVFAGGIISYCNEVKAAELGVSKEILDDSALGAVSAECAVAMARGVRERLNTTHALATTGIAGPTGALEGKPVGTVFVGYAGPTDELSMRFTFVGNRQIVRNLAVTNALGLLYRVLVRRG